MEEYIETPEEIILEQDSKMETYFTDSAYKAFFASIRKYPLLSKEENKELALRAQDGDQAAREKVINSNLRLVAKIAHKYASRIQHMQLLDIVQEGCLGLMKAVDKFDPERGAFSTCAYSWIDQAISRAIKNKEKEIRLPVNFDEKRIAYIKLLNEAERNGTSLPSDEEICKMLKISFETLYNIRHTTTISDSVNREMSEDTETEVENFIVVEDSSYDKILENMEDRRICVIAKEILSPKLYYVFYYRCLSDYTQTLDKIGQTLFITRERVRQLNNEALSKMRPFVDVKHPKYHVLINKFEEKNINYDNYNINPITPDKIALYYLLKKKLTNDELMVFHYSIFGKYIPSSNVLPFLKEEIEGILANVKQKIAGVYQNPKAFNDYKRRFVELNCDNLFNMGITDFLEKKDYLELKNKYSNLSYDEITKLINSTDINLSFKELKLIEKYFKLPSVTYKYSYDVIKELYLLEFQYKKGKKGIPVNKLWITYQEHLLDFTDEQQLFLECFFFHKIPKKVFKEKYPDRFPNHFSGNVISRLERYYYKIEDLNENSFNKEKYLVVKDKYSDKLTEERIKILDWFYGVNTHPLPITEIAILLGEDYITAHGKVRHARNYCISLYNNMSNTLNVDLKIYKKYILEKKYEFTDETRNILKMFVIDGYDYDKIDEITRLGKYRISNIITEGIRKIDFYRFGIIEVDNSTEKEIEEICDFYKSHFDELEIEIVKRRKVNKENPDELAVFLNISKDTINRTIAKYNRFYFQYKIKDVELSEEEILAEINRHSTESVINDQCKEILSVFYGFKTAFNQTGKILSVNEIKQEYGLTKSELYRRYNIALESIKGRKIEVLKNENVYIARDTLNNALNDVHLPITDKERELICYLFELKGYPLKTSSELADMYGNTKGSIKRRYQRAIVNINKYFNHEIEGILNYEVDIEPNLKYFSRYDEKFIKDFYRDNLTYDDIAKKYNYTFNIVVALMKRLKNNIYDLVSDKNATKFDFEYYRDNKLNEKLPFNGDLELVTSWFELFTGEDGKRRYSIPEICEIYDGKHSSTKIQKNITNLMLSYCKLRDGIYKEDIAEFTEQDVLNYYEKHKQEMAPSDAIIYERYLNKSANNKSINLPIIGDLLIEEYPNLYNLNRLTRLDIFKYIKRYYSIISPSIKEYLMYRFEIMEREFMSGKEINHVYRILNNLDRKMALADTDPLIRKRQIDNNN